MKTRFAPSPTGYMHLGNVRTALFSALFAKASNGKFLLRIEDTDLERSDEKYTCGIEEDLKWLGLHYDEGPDLPQGHEPYFQSKRSAIYEKYYQKLIDMGLAYPCFCSEEQLSVMRKSQLRAGQPPRYTGLCRTLSKQEIEEKMAQGIKPVLRFRVPENKTIELLDFVKGLKRFNSDDIGDFIIRRADGSPSFMFCNAIDDALMEVTHVIRGEDHLTNTPRQLMILQALGLPEPQYGHISLIMGFDGGPLSKRHGSSSIKDMRDQGVLPRALVNYLARLGHFYEDNSLMTINELADNFEVGHLSKSAAKFDHNQLTFWQNKALALLHDEEIWQWMGEPVHLLVPFEKHLEFVNIVRPNVQSPEDGVFWANIVFGEFFEIEPQGLVMIKEAGPAFFEEAIKAVDEFGLDFPLICKHLKETLKVKGKGLFMPLRASLTGQLHGPDLSQLLSVLGKACVKERLEKAKGMS